MDDVLTKWENELRAEGEKNGENRSAVRTSQYYGKTENETMLYLMQEYGMTQEDARSTTLKYWENASFSRTRKTTSNALT